VDPGLDAAHMPKRPDVREFDPDRRVMAFDGPHVEAVAVGSIIEEGGGGMDDAAGSSSKEPL
jgi:hypothetical protein